MILKNKKIVISAGASGIGWATAKVLDQRGAKVFVCDIDEGRVKAINSDKKNKIKAFVCNADEEKEVYNFFKEIKKNNSDLADKLISIKDLEI